MRRGLPKPGAPLGSPLSPLTPSVGRGNSAVFTLQLTGTPPFKSQNTDFRCLRPLDDPGRPYFQYRYPQPPPQCQCPLAGPTFSGPRPLTLRPPRVSEVPPSGGRPRPGLAIWRAREEGRIQTQAFTPPPPPPPPSRPDKGADARRGARPRPREERPQPLRDGGKNDGPREPDSWVPEKGC